MITPNRLTLMGIVQLILLLICTNHVIADEVPDRDREVITVLDEFMDALNRLDLVAHTKTMHFPHFRHTKGDIAILKSPHDYIPYIDLPDADTREGLRKMLGSEWDRSEWMSREIIQSSSAKIHVATSFVRLRKDGSKIAIIDSLYILTFEGGRWAIKGRSSFAPI